MSTRNRRGHARRCGFVPPYLMRNLAEVDSACSGTLDLDEQFRASRERRAPAQPGKRRATATAWQVHSANNTEELPGELVRSAGEAESGDAAVDEAAHGVSESLGLFADVYERDSYDGAGATVSATVHYGQRYANAFWDGTQLVFGDGDGRIFARFTKAVDVLAHEFTHAVVEHSAGLAYRDQPGALNESVADVFAACLQQRLAAQGPDDASWLIGEDLFLAGVQARALRDMAEPGTAYDDPQLGQDPQPAHMDDYVDTSDDNGGVHINSGIPNRAFVLAARAIGGSSWEGAGRIWYAALTGGDVGADTDFAGFAAATVAAAGDHADAAREAWAGVGVEPGAAGGNPGTSPAGTAAGRVRVRRTGGFAGLATSGEVDLSADDARTEQVRALVDRLDLPASVVPERPVPDAFTYTFEVDGTRVELPEGRLTDDLRRLVELVLGHPVTAAVDDRGDDRDPSE